MRRTIVTSTCLSCVLATVLHAAQLPSPTDVVDAFHAALGRGDTAGALAFLEPDVVIYEGGGVEASRDEYRQHHLAADMAFAAATSRAVTGRRAGSSGDLAWVLSETRVTGEFRERPVDSSGVETILLRRTDAGWRIVHIHWSSRRLPGG